MIKPILCVGFILIFTVSACKDTGSTANSSNDTTDSKKLEDAIKEALTAKKAKDQLEQELVSAQQKLQDAEKQIATFTEDLTKANENIALLIDTAPEALTNALTAKDTLDTELADIKNQLVQLEADKVANQEHITKLEEQKAQVEQQFNDAQTNLTQASNKLLENKNIIAEITAKLQEAKLTAESKAESTDAIIQNFENNVLLSSDNKEKLRTIFAGKEILEPEDISSIDELLKITSDDKTILEQKNVVVGKLFSQKNVQDFFADAKNSKLTRDIFDLLLKKLEPSEQLKQAFAVMLSSENTNIFDIQRAFTYVNSKKSPEYEVVLGKLFNIVLSKLKTRTFKNEDLAEINTIFKLTLSDEEKDTIADTLIKNITFESFIKDKKDNGFTVSGLFYYLKNNPTTNNLTIFNMLLDNQNLKNSDLETVFNFTLDSAATLEKKNIIEQMMENVLTKRPNLIKELDQTEATLLLMKLTPQYKNISNAAIALRVLDELVTKNININVEIKQDAIERLNKNSKIDTNYKKDAIQKLSE